MRSRYPISGTEVAQIFYPVDIETWKPVERAEARATLGIPQNLLVVAWHGRVAMHKKGLDLLCDAWDRICRERPLAGLRLLLVGTGDDAAWLQQRAGTMRGVTWINRFVHSTSELVRYLSAADIYAFPSRYEGFPVALVEAMACGLPVVAADRDGVPEILEGGDADGGLVVGREDAVALAYALGRLLDDPEQRQKLALRARKHAEASFSLKLVGEQLCSFLLGDRLKL